MAHTNNESMDVRENVSKLRQSTTQHWIVQRSVENYLVHQEKKTLFFYFITSNS